MSSSTSKLVDHGDSSTRITQTSKPTITASTQNNMTNLETPPLSPSSSPSKTLLAYHQKTDSLDGIHRIVLNRPAARNALSIQMLKELDQALDFVASSARPSTDLTKSSPLRALIIQSSTTDGVFCAGADLKERKEMTEEQVVEYLKNLRRVFDKIHFFPVPTVAAIDGAALGGGLELAIACDFRVASPKVAKLGFPEVGLGVIPGAGGTQRAPRLIGLTRAKEMIYTCRLLNSQEALAWGLIDYLSEGEETAIDRATTLAESMLSSAPLALSAAKQSISRGFEMELAQGLAFETECYETLLPTLDRREALKAFAEKRKAEFRGM